MSLLQAMLYQTKPKLSGRVYKHKLRDDDDEVLQIIPLSCKGVDRGIAIREHMLAMLSKDELPTVYFAVRLAITSRAALRHLTLLRDEGKVISTAPPGSRANLWVAL